MRVFPYIIVLLSCLMSANSFSLSCIPFLERVIAECSLTVCEDVLFVKDVPSSGACGRRPEISSPPSWAKPLLESEIRENEHFDGKKIFEITISHRFWYSSDEQKSFETYQKIKNENLRYKFYLPKLAIIEDKVFSQVTTEWEEKVQSEYQQDLLIKVIDWSVLILSLIALFFSVKWFREVLLKDRSKKYLLASILIQLILFTFGIMISGSWETFLLVLHMLLVPIIWIYEIIYSIINWVRKHAPLTSGICCRR